MPCGKSPRSGGSHVPCVRGQKCVGRRAARAHASCGSAGDVAVGGRSRCVRWQEPLLQAAGPLCQTVGDAVAGGRSHAGQQEPLCLSGWQKTLLPWSQEPMRRVDRQESCCGQQKLRWRLGVRREELLPRAAGVVTSAAGDAVAQETQFRAAGAALRIAGDVAAVVQEMLLRVANSCARHVQEMALWAAGAGAPTHGGGAVPAAPQRRAAEAAALGEETLSAAVALGGRCRCACLQEPLQYSCGGRQEALCSRNCCARRQEPLRWCGRNRCCGEPLLRAAGVATLCGRSRSAEEPLSGRKRGAHTQRRSTRVRVMRVLVGGHIRSNGVPKERVLSQQLRRQHKPRLAWSQPPWCTSLSCRRSTLTCPLRSSSSPWDGFGNRPWLGGFRRLAAGAAPPGGRRRCSAERPRSGRFQGVVGHPTFLFARVRGRIETVRLCAKARHFTRGGEVHIWSGQFVVALSRVADSYVAHKGLDTARPICLPSGALRQISSGRCYKVQPGTHTSEEVVEVCLSAGTLGKGVWVFVTSGNFGPS